MNYYNYYTEIEETFVRRRGKHLLLSPIDWAMIESWQERGIPLHVALRAIENVFDGFDKKPGPRTIKGLLYCREEIEAQYEEWVRSQTGKSGESTEIETSEAFSTEAIAEHIRGVIAHLRGLENKDLQDDLNRAASRLTELLANLGDDMELIDKTLTDIESFLDRAMLTNSEKLHLKTLEKEVSSQLKSYKSGMEADVYKKTFDMMLLKRLRESQGVPRLSLFYL